MITPLRFWITEILLPTREQLDRHELYVIILRSLLISQPRLSYPVLYLCAFARKHSSVSYRIALRHYRVVIIANSGKCRKVRFEALLRAESQSSFTNTWESMRISRTPFSTYPKNFSPPSALRWPLLARNQRIRAACYKSTQYATTAALSSRAGWRCCQGTS